MSKMLNTMTAGRKRELESLSRPELDRHIAKLKVHIQTLPRDFGYQSNKLIAESMLREAEEFSK
jgi:hypothetical protein